MKATLKAGAKRLLPPALADLLRRMTAQVVSFHGSYSTWAAASAASEGYDAGHILERVRAGTRKVVSGQAIYERDSVVFDRVEYSWPLLACLLQVALERGSLRVIDFGGSLGSTWRQNRVFFDRLTVPKSWCVVEQEEFVKAGAEFADKTLSFRESITTACTNDADVVLFSCSLCYVPDAFAVLSEAAASNTPYMIIDRLPINAEMADTFMVQKVREPIYPASYPIRIFSESRLRARLEEHWRVIEEWGCDVNLQPGEKTRYVGFFLERR